VIRGILSLSLLLIMMMQSLMQLGMIAYYNLNIEEIESLYCVNKDKPEMCCKGKCFIGKQLDKSQQELPVKNASEEKEFPFFLLPESKSNPIGLTVYSNNSDFSIQNTEDGFPLGVFYPPAFLA
jgi:hypothetical protein